MSFPPLAAALFAVSLCLFLFLRRRQCRDITGQTSSYSPVLVEKSFTTPAVPPQPPSTPWDTPPLPYRPFRWDTTFKHVMGIRPMAWEDWIQLDNEFVSFYNQKKARFQAREAKVVCTLPGHENAALEACTEIASFLAQRYPHMYSCTADEATGGLQSVTLTTPFMTNQWDMSKHDPMEVAGQLQQDDVVILTEELDGQYRFVAGSVCLAGSWRLEDKIGTTLGEVHLNGDVPHFKGKFQETLERFFQALKVNKPVERNNYQLQLDGELPWSNATMGEEETYGTTERDQLPAQDIARVYYRSERQTLRRLPKTGCILFTIRTYLLPVTELAKEPGVPGRLAQAIRTWPDELKKYKSGHRYMDVLLPFLDASHKRQVEDGVFTDANASKYPF